MLPSLGIYFPSATSVGDPTCEVQPDERAEHDADRGPSGRVPQPVHEALVHKKQPNDSGPVTHATIGASVAPGDSVTAWFVGLSTTGKSLSVIGGVFVVGTLAAAWWGLPAQVVLNTQNIAEVQRDIGDILCILKQPEGSNPLDCI